jgi:hypothetical protein
MSIICPAICIYKVKYIVNFRIFKILQIMLICVFQVFHCFFVAIMIVKVNFIFQYTGYNAVVMVDSSTDYLLHKAIYF